MSKIKVLFSTRDLELFRWVKQTIEDFADADEKVEIHLALTGKHIDVEDVTNGKSKLLGEHCHFDFKSKDGNDDEVEEIWDEEGSTSSSNSAKTEKSTTKGSSRVFVKYSHHDFDEEIEERSTVFSQGSTGLNNHVGEIFKKKKSKFYGGLYTSERFEMFDALIESIHRASANLRSSVSEYFSIMDYEKPVTPIAIEESESTNSPSTSTIG